MPNDRECAIRFQFEEFRAPPINSKIKPDYRIESVRYRPGKNRANNETINHSSDESIFIGRVSPFWNMVATYAGGPQSAPICSDVTAAHRQRSAWNWFKLINNYFVRGFNYKRNAGDTRCRWRHCELQVSRSVMALLYALDTMPDGMCCGMDSVQERIDGFGSACVIRDVPLQYINRYLLSLLLMTHITLYSVSHDGCALGMHG